MDQHGGSPARVTFCVGPPGGYPPGLVPASTISPGGYLTGLAPTSKDSYAPAQALPPTRPPDVYPPGQAPGPNGPPGDYLAGYTDSYQVSQAPGQAPGSFNVSYVVTSSEEANWYLEFRRRAPSSHYMPDAEADQYYQGYPKWPSRSA